MIVATQTKFLKMFFPQQIPLQIVSYPTEADDSHAKEIRPQLVPQTVSCSLQFHKCSDMMVFPAKHLQTFVMLAS